MKTLILAGTALVLVITPTTLAGDGQAVFAKKCAKCHGDDGKGDTKIGKKLKIEDLTAKVCKLSDETLTKAVTEGVTVDGKQKMKPIKGLTEDEVKAVVEFMKTLK